MLCLRGLTSLLVAKVSIYYFYLELFIFSPPAQFSVNCFNLVASTTNIKPENMLALTTKADSFPILL